VLISEKRSLFRIFDKSENEVIRDIVELNRKIYQAAKGSVKRAILRTQEAERKKIVLSAINTVSGFIEGIVVFLVNCSQYSQWIHGRYSGVSGKLFSDVRGVLMGIFLRSVAMKEIMISLLDKLECVDKFCYLGDLIDAGGGAEEVLFQEQEYVVPGQSSGNWLQY